MTNIRDLLNHRILIIDGAMGTMIQRYKLSEEDFRGERFKDWPTDIKGNILFSPSLVTFALWRICLLFGLNRTNKRRNSLWVFLV